ncbi:response regulator [Geobacter sp. DSM 9736]|uniref:response regulator n=1 Tax=Geobacter sp. DSM 9736 TaxID=1277350 RepID=UPI000B513101|nr:response regulator [Geobacter sp. DSM 9736]SNB46317.1 two-component system, unclassified family, response regulator [Geobacter sp. DSM 9736]
MDYSKTILLVDDNPDFVELAKRAFQKSKILNPVVVAEDGVEALDYLFCTGPWADRCPKDNPVVVLLDLKLPKLDGLEVLARMRSTPKTKIVPVVILTTSSEDQDVSRAYGLGANSYLRKPVDFNKLTEALQTTGLYWLLHNEPPDPRGPE